VCLCLSSSLFKQDLTSLQARSFRFAAGHFERICCIPVFSSTSYTRPQTHTFNTAFCCQIPLLKPFGTWADVDVDGWSGSSFANDLFSLVTQAHAKVFPFVFELYRTTFQKVTNTQAGVDHLSQDLEISLLAFKILSKLTIYGRSEPHKDELSRVSIFPFIFILKAADMSIGLFHLFCFRCFYFSTIPP
jgi:hypothetical protein